MSSFCGIWKAYCVLDIKQYCWTVGWTVFTHRFLKYTLEREKKKNVSDARGSGICLLITLSDDDDNVKGLCWCGGTPIKCVITSTRVVLNM